MEKLYNKDKVHPSPPSPTVRDHLSLLPATILSLVAALSFQDKEVLAYLISCCNTNSSSGFSAVTMVYDNKKEHDPRFECKCLRCYMCFWGRWDKSPNRELIHEVIEAYEEELLKKQAKKKKKKKKGRRKRVAVAEKGSAKVNKYVKKNCQIGDDEIIREVESEKGSIRKMARFIGDSIWGVLSL
ncbi:uncharacterized protein LOC108471423 [Gossypium arboreum]|uniref:Uncharacterized protein n=1 Tax=Gossypium arboreum TaxID=29729 RepID=A0ABR0N1P4_GOSAR|nr:uncharacterized protein LOC108471423 [Gossypium arboreum]KAK5784300.1 hypothetical protein PVK06_038823 [Gossypium arboreum]